MHGAEPDGDGLRFRGFVIMDLKVEYLSFVRGCVVGAEQLEFDIRIAREEGRQEARHPIGRNAISHEYLAVTLHASRRTACLAGCSRECEVGGIRVTVNALSF